MSFPQPLPLPEEVLLARKARGKALVRMASWGIAIRLFIVIFELTGFFLFSSRALLLDAISTAADVCSSILLVIFVKLAARPPDRNHPFGHGKFEPLAGLQLGLFLALAGVYLAYEQFLRLFTQVEVTLLDPHVWLFPLVAVVLLEMAYRRMVFVARRENSPALAAEAIHFRVDGLNSLLALAALSLAAFFPHLSVMFDSLGAVGIALFMVGMGSFAAKQNLSQITDQTPSREYFSLVKEAAMSIKGVLGIEKIRIQLSGPSAHVDVDVEVAPDLSVEKAHTISQYVRTEIQKAWPQVQDVIVHIEPYYPDDHADVEISGS